MVTTTTTTLTSTTAGTPSAAASSSTLRNSRPLSGKACPMPPNIQNGIISPIGPYFPGSVATYSCLAGFTLQGTSSILCTVTSAWYSQPPTCVPIASRSHVNTDVDVAVDASSDEHHYFLLLIILGVVLSIAVLGLIIALCCRWSRYCHGNTVLPFLDNNYYRQEGCCCCKRYVDVNKGQRHKSTSQRDIYPEYRPDVTKTVTHSQDINNTPRSHVVHHGTMVLRDESDAKMVHNLSETIACKNASTAKRPVAWMPHANPVRNINTSTK